MQQRSDFAKDFADLKRRVSTLETANRLNHASITDGGLTVKNGGNITIEDGGDLVVADNGNVVVQDGGDVLIKAPGIFRSEYPDGAVGVYFGQIGNPLYEHGIFVADNEGKATFFSGELADGSSNSQLLGRFVFVGTGDGTTFPAWINFDWDGEINLDGVNFRVAADNTFITHTTTAAGANAVLNVNGLLQRSTSSRRYKTDIEDAPPVEPREVLNLRVTSFRDKAAVEADPKRAPTITGLIAEEVAEHPTLRPFVTFNEEGEPDAIQYDRLWLSLIPVVRDQQRQLDEQRTLIDTLTRQVALLTERLDTVGLVARKGTQKP